MHFICPICKQELMVTHRTLSCKQGHSFDIAKSGYYPLYLSQKKEHGDNAQLVQSRIHFLEQDHYLFLKEEIIDCFKQYPITSCMDLGCGEGYYTRALPCNEVVGFDLSKKAIDYAQKKDKKHQYVVSSIFSLPLREHSIDAALTIFAPLAKEEILRILKPNGYLIFVSPAEDHLIELKEYLYEKAYHNIEKKIPINMELIEERHIHSLMHLKQEDIQHLFLMTPYAYKTSIEATSKLNQIEEMAITASFRISIFQKK